GGMGGAGAFRRRAHRGLSPASAGVGARRIGGGDRRQLPSGVRTQDGGAAGVPFVAGTNHFQDLSSQETAVEMSGQLRAAAVALTKIANDLRWMNSGP